MDQAGDIPVRLEYDEVEDAVLDPRTARLVDGVLSVSGVVRGSGVHRGLAPGVGLRDRIPLTLVISPVDTWRFTDLERGTGELLAGPFHATERGGRITGVVPGDLVFSSPAEPSAWFETIGGDSSGRPLVRRRAPLVPPEKTAAQLAGVRYRAIGMLGLFVAFLAFFALTAGLVDWDWNLASALDVRLGRRRGRGLVLHFAQAWHYFLPFAVAEVVGIVAGIGGMMAAINPKRQ